MRTFLVVVFLYFAITLNLPSPPLIIILFLSISAGIAIFEDFMELQKLLNKE